MPKGSFYLQVFQHKTAQNLNQHGSILRRFLPAAGLEPVKKIAISL